jgi:hypothetical protein
MDSDSDDDDLLAPPTFNTRKARVEEKKREKKGNLLDSILKDSNRDHERLLSFTQIKRETAAVDDEQLRAAVQDISASQTYSRQETLDAMEGIQADGDEALDRNRRRDLAQAMLTDQSTCLGARKIISFDPNRAKSLVNFYSTARQALEALDEILITIDKSNGYEYVVVHALRAALQENVVLEFLQQKRLVKLLVKNNIPEVHFELANWLIRLTQSSGLELTQLHMMARAALQTLLKLRRAGKLSKTFFAAASLESFCSSLECWVDLYLSRKPSATNEVNTSTDLAMESSVDNLEGLNHLLQFWKDAIPDHCARLCRDVTVTKCIVALSRVGLDRKITSNDMSNMMRTTIRQIITNLLDLVVDQQICATPDDHVEWMNKTAQAVLQHLSDLGPGLPGSEDKEDSKGWLCHSLILGLFPPASSFKAILCMQALKICLGVKDMNAKVHSILSKTSNLAILERALSSLSWLTLASTYAALMEIDMAGDDIVLDGPRCLATVECAYAAHHAGAELLTDSMEATTNEYGSEEDAATVVHMLGLLDAQCQQLSKRMEPMLSNPHSRRVDYNLMCSRHYYRTIKSRAATLAGDAKKTSVQKGIAQYLNNTLTASPIGG